MNADSYFEIGATHKVCQDYAKHGETENMVYAVIADGCSEAENSDIGARILMQAFLRSMDNVIRDFTEPSGQLSDNICENILPSYILDKVTAVCRVLNYPYQVMEATLVAAVYSKLDKQLYLFMWGDGNIILKRSGITSHYHGFYPSGAPYYLIYRSNPKLKDDYIEEFGPHECHYTFITHGDEENLSIERKEMLFKRITDISDLEFVLVSSDGAQSYLDEKDKPDSVFPEFYAFKSREGEFVQRRMQKLKRNISTTAYSHYDDISVAAINFK